MAEVQEQESEQEDEGYPKSSEPAQIPPPPPTPSTVNRLYYVGESHPLLVTGRCAACKRNLLIGPKVYDDNSPQKCDYCGAITFRLDALRGALADLDTTQWSLFSCDRYIYDNFAIQPGSIVNYTGAANPPIPKFEKWLRHDAWIQDGSGRYQANPLFLETLTYFLLRDQWPGTVQPDPLPSIGYSWYRYGLSAVGAVPAWRQALFGAVTLVLNNPAAAVVLIAAGFEAYFVETMRIAWKENGLDEAAFRRLDRNTLTSLVEWLPAAVRFPSLVDAPNGLHGRWRTLVNQRRNDVVHRADVQVTSEQAQESLNVTLEAVTFLDPFALTRPHAYFVGQ